MSNRYPEKLFRANFVKWFKGLYPNDHIQSIESEATAAGIPDINACKGGKEVWIELKSGTLSTNSIKPGQFVWHIKRNQAGGTTWIVQRDTNGLIRVYNGARIREFREKPNSVIPDMVFSSETRESHVEMFNYLFDSASALS